MAGSFGYRTVTRTEAQPQYIVKGLASSEQRVRVSDMIGFLIPVKTARDSPSRVPSPQATGSWPQPLSPGTVVLHHCLLDPASALPIYFQQTNDSVNTCFPLAAEHSIVLLAAVGLLGKKHLASPKCSLVFQLATVPERLPGGDSFLQVPSALLCAQ